MKKPKQNINVASAVTLLNLLAFVVVLAIPSVLMYYYY
jgi:hypothetical protein